MQGSLSLACSAWAIPRATLTFSRRLRLPAPLQWPSVASGGSALPASALLGRERKRTPAQDSQAAVRGQQDG